jgi:hypothetical protein
MASGGWLRSNLAMACFWISTKSFSLLLAPSGEIPRQVLGAGKAAPFLREPNLCDKQKMTSILKMSDCHT